MNKWTIHTATEENRITHYKCGLVAGQRVRLKKDLVIKAWDGVPTGEGVDEWFERVSA